MNDDVAIKVEGVHKSFKLPHESVNSLKSSIVNFWRRERGYEMQHVLKDVSFEIKKGEFFGIVGRNGSGKSTLLKLISQIYTPDKGSVQVNGRLTPFIELGVGFSPELSGRDNVYLNGALLGFNRQEMDAMYDEIVAFAELERFMDQKLKNYSSGMQVRLAFSIAIRANSDILVLDEVLAVGDEAFQKKCYGFFSEIKKNKKTVILVTHDMNAVENFCTRAILLSNGEIKDIGSPSKVAGSYVMENVMQQPKRVNAKKSEKEKTDYSGGIESGVKITDLKVLNKGKPSDKFKINDTMSVVIEYEASVDQNINIGVSFRKTTDEVLLAAIGSRRDLGPVALKKGKGSMRCDVPIGQFRKDSYLVNASIWNTDDGRLLDFRDSTMGSEVPIINVVESVSSRAGLFNLSGTWHNPDRGVKISKHRSATENE